MYKNHNTALKFKPHLITVCPDGVLQNIVGGSSLFSCTMAQVETNAVKKETRASN